jgi:hypothetical protein
LCLRDNLRDGLTAAFHTVAASVLCDFERAEQLVPKLGGERDTLCRRATASVRFRYVVILSVYTTVACIVAMLQRSPVIPQAGRPLSVGAQSAESRAHVLQNVSTGLGEEARQSATFATNGSAALDLSIP